MFDDYKRCRGPYSNREVLREKGMLNTVWSFKKKGCIAWYLPWFWNLVTISESKLLKWHRILSQSLNVSLVFSVKLQNPYLWKGNMYFASRLDVVYLYILFCVLFCTRHWNVFHQILLILNISKINYMESDSWGLNQHYFFVMVNPTAFLPPVDH